MENTTELLIHFTSIESLMKMLLTDSLRLTHINGMNDSYEFLDLDLGKKSINIDDNIDDYKYDNDQMYFDDTNNVIDYKIRELAGRVANCKKDLYLTCFYRYDVPTEYCDENKSTIIYDIFEGIETPSMWAHYGDKNKGVALIFDKNKLVELLETQFKDDNIFVHHKKILYGRNLVTENIFNEMININTKITKENFEEYKMKFEVDLIENYYFTKHIDWNYEKEYRFLLLDKRKDKPEVNLLNGIIAAIKGLTFGIKTSNSDIKIIHSILELKNLNIVGCINKTYSNWKFYEPYPRFLVEDDRDPYLKNNDYCKCEECNIKGSCLNYDPVGSAFKSNTLKYK